MTNAIFYQFLQRFCPFTETESDALFALFEPLAAGRKQHLQQEGDRVERVYFVQSGVLRGYYLKEGEEITSNFYFGPTLTGDVVALREKTTTRLNIQVIEEGILWQARLAQIDELSEQYPIMYRLFMVFFERLYAFNHKRQLSFIYDTPTERYLKLFAERPKVIAQIPQHYIASYLGIKPESLSRIRKRIMHE
ncbi:Crp/Fnr family transcriptional regulator [Spirosoma fluviale]|uniref:cAMP-binding domain of CRP or a regulatory subunit of cAMP-dependent protein kinases n=1 Tax=Spirosoma fluviale TaxID=1597977 RepID=A0A286GKQ6_9BACT|nr:Crp/Fnr family transcriptional regulator [Spirosoma fluviale]SOD96118.1 cAMP-binding domain of CRP or a regulatory subunit of cAMP-dependent protein kinases [Spirosoma fluviale]